MTMLPGHVHVSEHADVSIGSQADLAGFVEDYGSSDNFMPAAPANDVQKLSDIVADESEGGNVNINKIPAAHGGTPGIFNYWINPADPTGQIQEWRAKVVSEAEKGIIPDFDLSLLLPWNWIGEVKKHLLAQEEAKEGGSLPLAASGAIGVGMEQAEKARRGAVDVLNAVGDPDDPKNPVNWLTTETGLMAIGAVGFVLLILIIK